MEAIKKALREGLPCNTQGYLRTFQENVYTGSMQSDFQGMFRDGSGNELDSKAKAVHSSSMLGYNFFHWVTKNRPLTIDGIDYTKVFFEVKMTVLKGTNPANMDILLIGKKKRERKIHLLFIESKFLEYLENKEYKLGISYENSQKWQDKDTIWMDFLNAVRKCVDEESICKYKEGIKQGVSHMFALSNLAHKNENAISDLLRKNKCLGHDLNEESVKGADIHFINLIFEPSEKCFQDEHKKFKDYETLYNKFMNIVKGHTCINPTFMTYSELWQMAQNQIMKVNNGHLHQYLNDRYMRFAEMK